jgi:terminase small subunit / prophage DNA-packing protein
VLRLGVCTQAEFGALVGVSQQAVSEMLQRGVLRDGDTASAWLVGYCAHLRTVASGRDVDSELSSQRTRVARETADKLALENAVSRREFAPIALLESVLADVARQVSIRLDSLAPLIKRRLPDLPAAAVAQIEAEVSLCREICAAVNLQSADDADDDEDDAPAAAESVAAA